MSAFSGTCATATPRSCGTIPQVEHLGDALETFADTAAVMASLDLIISSDTSLVHLAGALGKPIWILLPYSPDWRWLLDRNDSPWYPTARLFRQARIDDWSGVVERATEELARLRKASKPDRRADRRLRLTQRPQPIPKILVHDERGGALALASISRSGRDGDPGRPPAHLAQHRLEGREDLFHLRGLVGKQLG